MNGNKLPDVVLLVDDEAVIRKLARTVLEGRGYVVLDACDGLEGLELCKAHAGQIDLLLSDVLMPGLGGRELAAGALKMRPGLKILFMSGHNEDIIVEDGIRRGTKVRATIDLQPPA
jgi:two-component system cell cycle sensor histidine kinase/response regulator CckA